MPADIVRPDWNPTGSGEYHRQKGGADTRFGFFAILVLNAPMSIDFQQVILFQPIVLQINFWHGFFYADTHWEIMNMKYGSREKLIGVEKC